MLEKVANNWAIGLHSFFDVAHFTPIVPNLWNKQMLEMQGVSDTKIKKTDVLLGHLILFWSLLYLMYEKCLNSLLRRMRIPLMQRSRIIEAAWSCGFCFGSICYLKSSSIKFLTLSTTEQQVTHEHLGVILHKSFYLHCAGIEILRHGAWARGLANMFFALFILNPYQEKWCTVVSTFLYYKAIDTVVINLCRILLCVSHFIGKRLPKLFFGLHCLNWIYLYVIFVPKLMLWPEKSTYTRAELGLWLWFIAECLSSVWLRLVGCAKAVHWLEICLFHPPSQEAIELAGIQKRHRDSVKKSLSARAPKKTELWQTLFCAMAIKKKIKRIRQAKQSDSVSLINSNANETEIKTEVQAESEIESESEAGSEAGSEAKSEAGSEAKSVAGSEAKSGAGSEVDTEAEVQFGVKAETEAEVQVQVAVEAEGEMETEMEAQTETETETEIQVEAKAETEILRREGTKETNKEQ